MALHIVSEANRCLNCKKPLCQQGCPVHTPIPQVIQLFKENKLMEAGEMLFQNNPMSAVCSIVYNHEKQCAGNCIRGRKDSPVHFSSIESYISDCSGTVMPASSSARRGEAPEESGPHHGGAGRFRVWLADHINHNIQGGSIYEQSRKHPSRAGKVRGPHRGGLQAHRPYERSSPTPEF